MSFTGLTGEALRLHRKHCLYSCQDCRATMTTEQARGVMTPAPPPFPRPPPPPPPPPYPYPGFYDDPEMEGNG